MAGTKLGGKKAALTNKAKYGDKFYANIGRIGGRNGHTGGFAANPELARRAGAKGGKISKRGKAKSKISKENNMKKTIEINYEALPAKHIEVEIKNGR